MTDPKDPDYGSSPFPFADVILKTHQTGIQPGKLTVISGRRGGKSSMMLQAFAQRFRKCEHDEFQSECQQPECVVARVMES